MPQDEASPLMRAVLSTVLGLGGLAMTIVGVRRLLLAANPVQDEAMSLTLLGLCILFFGLTISVPPIVSFRQRLLQALAITFMALLFDWVAFVPGPREFHAGASAGHPGAPVNSTFGRVVFGGTAVVMDLCALYVWRLTIRLLMTGSEVKPSTEATRE